MKNVIFYTQAGPGIGLGHVSRCLVLANELENGGHHCSFVGNEHVTNRVEQNGFSMIGHAEEALSNADVCIVDMRGGVPLDFARAVRDLCTVFVILDDCAPPPDLARFLTDLMIYPGITNRPYDELDWTDFDGRWFEGADWIMLHKQFQNRPKKKRHGNRVIISGGGSDPLDVTTKILDALSDSSFDLCAIIGPNNTLFEPHGFPDVKIVYSPRDMAEALEWGDVAVVTYGSTVFESLALELPVITVPVFGDQNASASLVAKRSGGVVYNLGEIGTWGDADAVRAAEKMFSLNDLQRARAFVDGKGAQRVAQKIMEAAC